jgi:hypothetical protein
VIIDERARTEAGVRDLNNIQLEAHCLIPNIEPLGMSGGRSTLSVERRAGIACAQVRGAASEHEHENQVGRT